MPIILAILIGLLVAGMVLAVIYVIAPPVFAFVILLTVVALIGFTMVGLARWLERRLGRTEINRAWHEGD